MTNNIDWVTKKGNPLPVVTIDGLDQWRSEGAEVLITYELVTISDAGVEMYRCCALSSERNQIHVLVEREHASQSIIPIKIEGVSGVHAHRLMHGGDDFTLIHRELPT